MKDTDIYNRLNDGRIVKTYIKMIRECDLDTVNKLYKNIEAQANDHSRFPDIKAIYDDRIKHTEK